MADDAYKALVEITRGSTAESYHFGAIAVSNPQGELIASYGDPQKVSYLRSSAKPFQALPFILAGGATAFKLSAQEIAVLCASHTGTDEHVATVAGIQKKASIPETALQCGTHRPYDQATADRLVHKNLLPTANQHNCSGKHTGMLAMAKLSNTELATYLDFEHPLQKTILAQFAALCQLPAEAIALGVDGCSAPNFAVPLINAAIAFAQIANPIHQPLELQEALQLIANSMMAYPQMVAGPGRLDTQLMQALRGLVLSKGGAEGYQGLSVMAAKTANYPEGLGISIKIADGDINGRARSIVALEVLRQLGVIDQAHIDSMEALQIPRPVQNWRKLNVGLMRPCFQLRFT